jgi:hypothetical protein
MTKRYNMARLVWDSKWRYYRSRRNSLLTWPIQPYLTPRQIMALQLPESWVFGRSLFQSIRFTSTCSECEPAPNKVIPVNYDGECVACGRLLRSGLPFPMRSAYGSRSFRSR